MIVNETLDERFSFTPVVSGSQFDALQAGRGGTIHYQVRCGMT